MRGISLDVMRWGSQEAWEAIDAAFILAGVEPQPDPAAAMPSRSLVILDAIKSALIVERLKPVRVTASQCFFLAAELVSWANEKSFPLAPGLAERVAATAAAYVAAHAVNKQCAPTANPGATRASMLPAVKHKLRTNSLDAPIDKAIARAASSNTGPVFLQLRALALEEEKPFTGAVNGDALCYTTDDGKPGLFTKNALEHRLRSRNKGSKP